MLQVKSGHRLNLYFHSTLVHTNPSIKLTLTLKTKITSRVTVSFVLVLGLAMCWVRLAYLDWRYGFNIQVLICSFCCGRVFALFSPMDHGLFSAWVVQEVLGQQFVFTWRVTNQMNQNICWTLRYVLQDLHMPKPLTAKNISVYKRKNKTNK